MLKSRRGLYWSRFNLEVESKKEVRDSLFGEGQFRARVEIEDEIIDRGFGILGVLGSERFGPLVEWCYKRVKEDYFPGKIGDREGT